MTHSSRNPKYLSRLNPHKESWNCPFIHLFLVEVERNFSILLLLSLHHSSSVGRPIMAHSWWHSFLERGRGPRVVSMLSSIENAFCRRRRRTIGFLARRALLHSAHTLELASRNRLADWPNRGRSVWLPNVAHKRYYCSDALNSWS